MLTAKDIELKNAPVIVKWDKPLVDNNGNVTDGVMAGQAQEFITRIEEQSRLLGMLRYIEMDGETQDIQALRVRAELWNMNKISGTVGAQVDNITSLTEVTPGILKNTLTAQPFTAYTKIPKTFLKTNIEKEGFIAKYESLLVPSCAFKAEQIAIFGKATFADAKGIHALDGILAQLDAVAGDYLDSTTHAVKDAKAPQGHFGVHWNSESTETDKTEYVDINAGEGYAILPQLDAMLEQFTAQRGKRRLANFYVSSKMESRIISELGKRETELGDRMVYDTDGNVKYKNRSIVQLDALDVPENSYGDVVILMNPDSVGYGPVMEAESESEYKIELKSYLTSVDWMFDVGVIFAEDVLYAKVDYTPSS